MKNIKICSWEIFCRAKNLLNIIPPIKIEPQAKFRPLAQISYNAELDKSLILKDLTNRSGLYLWFNTVNSKIYVGCSVNLRNRLLLYLNCGN